MNKTCVVVVSGSLEKLQMAAMVTSVAAVSGHETLVFLTMNALPFFTRNPPSLAPTEGPVGDLMRHKKVPDFKNLFEQSVELGDARIFPCSMAMDVLAIGPADLEPFLGEATGLTRFLDDASGAQIWTF